MSDTLKLSPDSIALAQGAGGTMAMSDAERAACMALTVESLIEAGALIEATAPLVRTEYLVGYVAQRLRSDDANADMLEDARALILIPTKLKDADQTRVYGAARVSWMRALDACKGNKKTRAPRPPKDTDAKDTDAKDVSEKNAPPPIPVATSAADAVAWHQSHMALAITYDQKNASMVPAVIKSAMVDAARAVKNWQAA